MNNTIQQAVWIEKDKRTIGTGNAWVLLIRGPKIQFNQLSTTLPLHEVGGGKGGIFSVPKRKEGFQFVYLNFVVFILKLPICD